MSYADAYLDSAPTHCPSCSLAIASNPFQKEKKIEIEIESRFPSFSCSPEISDAATDNWGLS